jgi:DNA-binding transcriptional LysR family regulator
MDLNLLAHFVAVAEASSFSAAAAKLGLRRSSVSRAVAALERSVGVQLFNRTTRSVALTTAGTTLYARVSVQLAALKEAVGSLPEREALPSGELRVTAPNDLGAVVLAPALAGFSARYPAVVIDARLTNRRVDLVTEGFDAALRISIGRLSDSSLVARRLSVLEMQVFAAPTYLARAGTPRAPKDTAGHAWVLMRGQKLPPPFPAPSVKPRIVGDDVLFVCRAVGAGAGLGVLPTFLAREELAAGRLVRVLPRFSQRSGALYLVHPPARHVARKVTALRDYLVEHFTSYPLAGRAP